MIFSILILSGWTKLLREMCIRNEKNPERNPNLYIDGPFGEAHQDYLNYEVSWGFGGDKTWRSKLYSRRFDSNPLSLIQVVVLVGGGIGVTPFASILKDLVHRSKHSNVNKVKKVYFLWASRSQVKHSYITQVLHFTNLTKYLKLYKYNDRISSNLAVVFLRQFLTPPPPHRDSLSGC